MAPFVALCGFMGSGKSSVGAEAARLLGWTFVDLDEELVRTEGGIAAFFAERGETAFRERESTVLRDIVEKGRPDRGLVIALGGGTLEAPGCLESLRGRGGVVLLDVDAEVAWRRVQGSDRPLARDRETFDALLCRRRRVYQKAADWVLPVEGRTVRDLAEELARLVSEAGEDWSKLWGRRLSVIPRTSLIVGGEGALALLRLRARSVRERGSRLFIITDSNVMRSWGDEATPAVGGTESGSVLVVETRRGQQGCSDPRALLGMVGRERRAKGRCGRGSRRGSRGGPSRFCSR